MAAANHTATHLLHQALREVLGTHVEQKGSLVNPDYLRFDFSHFAKVTDEELARIEELVNERIRQQLGLDERRNVPIDEAKKSGAMMLFGEKYGESVRMIRFGESVELCGGTHVGNTAVIGYFKVTSEGAVAAGVRRIEAISYKKAFSFINDQFETLESLRNLLKAKDVTKSVNDLLHRNQELEKKIELLNQEKVKGIRENLKSSVSEIQGISFLARELDLEAAEMKDLAFQLRQQYPRLLAVLTSKAGGKPTITCVIGDEAVKEKGWNASQIVRDLATEIKGGGGGQPFFATAGGTDASGLDRVLSRAGSLIS
jgi:alanyl-tRNA synthetase